jgi:hypothetical protein
MANDRATSTRISLLALASLVCGVIGVVWPVGIGSLGAVMLGHLALRRLRHGGNGGRILAILGLVLGYVGIVITFVVLVGGNISVQGGP